MEEYLIKRIEKLKTDHSKAYDKTISSDVDEWEKVYWDSDMDEIKAIIKELKDALKHLLNK